MRLWVPGKLKCPAPLSATVVVRLRQWTQAKCRMRYPSNPKQAATYDAQQRHEELVEMFEGKLNIKDKWQLEAKLQLAYARSSRDGIQESRTVRAY